MEPARRVLCVLILAFLPWVPARAETLTVFAAASLQESLDEAARAFEKASGHVVRISYAASSALAKQVEAGAPAQLFICADEEWMDYVESRKLLKRARVNLLTNAIVLIAPAGKAPKLRIEPGFALAAALGDGRLAMADTQSVPAGKYGRAALESLGAWAQVQGRLAPAESVRAALALVARAEAPLGIVYRSDAQAEPRVAVVDTFPESSHRAIVYPMGVLRDAPGAADDLAAFLAAPGTRAIWRRHGFGFPG
ncbi:MAG TPA: molybdate ABC transporter substrate-binding protein [Usitatibacter sp.]